MDFGDSSCPQPSGQIRVLYFGSFLGFFLQLQTAITQLILVSIDAELKVDVENDLTLDQIMKH